MCDIYGFHKYRNQKQRESKDIASSMDQNRTCPKCPNPEIAEMCLGRSIAPPQLGANTETPLGKLDNRQMRQLEDDWNTTGFIKAQPK